MKYLFTLCLIYGCLLQTCFAQDWKTFPYKPAESRVSFPVDEGRHTSEPVEWWYTSGQLTGKSSGKTYSFMLTYFYFPALTFDGFRILNIMDDATGKFYRDTKPLNYTELATTYLDIKATLFSGEKESWSNIRDDAEKLIPYTYAIKAHSPVMGIDLKSTSLKRPLILDEDGFLEQGLNNYTYYYSLTRNKVEGKLTLNGEEEEVSGISWIDRQYGNFNPHTGEKYEWFQVQLSNGMDMNFWNIFTFENKISDSKKYRVLSVYVDDQTQYTTGDFSLERLEYQMMADKQMCYSSKWRLKSKVNNIDLIITAKDTNAEVVFPIRFYEGATEITGTVNGSQVTGFGFAELLHTYESPKVVFTTPQETYYDPSLPISWTISNPDEGLPLKYDLAYSIDEKATWVNVIEGMKDTSFLWANLPLKGNENIWFKVTASSADNKLMGFAISDQALKVKIPNAGSGKINIYPNPVKDVLMIHSDFQMDDTR
ncbi:MAG: lipocalin-like domain-containing protein [Ginsengibacter sp.]